MYRQLKSIARSLLPAAWLRVNELRLRKWYVRLFFQKGNCLCLVCGQPLARFIPIDKQELLCPACGSGKRHRRLFQLLTEIMNARDALILDFSPNPGFAHYASRKWGAYYRTTNFEASDKTDFHFDITRIAAADNSFGIILCYHVLEHIEEDRKAMQELLRVLQPGGLCLLQTPFKEGEIYENPAVVTPGDRLIHFEQEDHVRIYSVSGLADRLREAGFRVHIKTYLQGDNPGETFRLGFKEQESIILATKPE